MAPLYQHFKKQKSPPALLNVAGFNFWSQSTWSFWQSSGMPSPTLQIRYDGTVGGYTNNAIAYQSAPSGAKTAIMKWKSNNIVSGSLGLIFRNSSTGKSGGMFAQTVGTMTYGGVRYSGSPYNSGWQRIGFNEPPTTYQGQVSSQGYAHSVDTYYWMKLVDDGTNVATYWSADGVNYTASYSWGRSEYGLQTCDQVGFLTIPGYASTANGGWGSGAIAGSAGYGGNNYTIADFTCV